MGWIGEAGFVAKDWVWCVWWVGWVPVDGQVGRGYIVGIQRGLAAQPRGTGKTEGCQYRKERVHAPASSLPLANGSLRCSDSEPGICWLRTIRRGCYNEASGRATLGQPEGAPDSSKSVRSYHPRGVAVDLRVQNRLVG